MTQGPNRAGLAPVQIVGVDLPRKMRGYAVEAVDELLARLASQIEQGEQDRDALRARVRQAEARLAAALEAEATLKRRLVAAQQAAEGQLDDARQQAADIRAAAEREVLRRLADAEAEAGQVVGDARETIADERQAYARERADAEHRLAATVGVVEQSLRTMRAQLDEQLALLRGLPAPSVASDAEGAP